MKKAFFALLLGLFACQILPAQTQDAPPTFRIISSSGSYGGLFYDIGTGRNKITIPVSLNQTLSAPMVRPSGSTLEIYRLIPPPPDAPPDTPPTRVVVVDATFPSAETDYIVVAFPLHPTRDTLMMTKLVPPSNSSHKAGTVKVINFSSFSAGVGLDESQRALNSGDISIMHCGTGRVLLQVAVSKGGGWAKAFRGERRLAPELRGYVFIFNYMVDLDYGPDAIPPPALVKTFFEVSPETIEIAKR